MYLTLFPEQQTHPYIYRAQFPHFLSNLTYREMFYLHFMNPTDSPSSTFIQGQVRWKRLIFCREIKGRFCVQITLQVNLGFWGLGTKSLLWPMIKNSCILNVSSDKFSFTKNTYVFNYRWHRLESLRGLWVNKSIHYLICYEFKLPKMTLGYQKISRMYQNKTVW